VNAVVLLTDPDRPQAIPAANYAREFFEVRQVQWHLRSEKRLREICAPADYLLNFLSAPYVPSWERSKYRMAINFHPAPPEYPGVGSASRALYDGRTEHGVTAHLMDDQYDHGLILRTRRFPIEKGWGYRQLFDRALDESLLLFVDICRLLSSSILAPLRHVEWSGPAMTRRQFSAHPSFVEVAK